jgi:hypothetical protein
MLDYTPEHRLPFIPIESVEDFRLVICKGLESLWNIKSP